MAYKFIDAGDYLTAADVQNYLMNQSVMIFAAGTSARDTALGTAVTEGMVTYVGSGVFEVYDGSTWKRWP